jgi:hypothetical protein
MAPNWKWLAGGAIAAYITYRIYTRPMGKTMVFDPNGWQPIKATGSTVTDLIAEATGKSTSSQILPIETLPKGCPTVPAGTPGTLQVFWMKANDTSVSDNWPIRIYAANIDEDNLANSTFYRISAKQV